ncbi:MAG: type III pantothenate kinase [Verrucomicrobiales bacterium]
MLSSVVPGKNAAVRDAVPCPLLVLDHTCELGVAIDYPRPETIGADRLANAAAAAALYGCPSVVIDFGTAVTFDVLSAAGAYTGGVIAPGLEAMTHYLHERTALLPEIDLTEPTSPVGRSTRDAMLAGAVIGYRGLVKEILSAVMEEIGSPDAANEVIATGGYAELIGAKVPAIAHVHPTLTLEGLRIAANLNPIP